MRAEYCKLSWEVPEDDGGTPLTHYVVSLMDLLGGTWVNVLETQEKAADIQGLRPGHLYR